VYARAGAGYFFNLNGARTYGANTGAGALYGLNNLLSLALGIDYQYARTGLDFTHVPVTARTGDLHFLQIHAGVVLNF